MRIEIKIIREPQLHRDYIKGVKDSLEVLDNLHREEAAKCRKEYDSGHHDDGKWWDTRCCGYITAEERIRKLIEGD